MPLEINPHEITIEPERYETGLNVLAYWRGLKVGLAACSWNDDGRLVIGDLQVEDKVVIKPKGLFRPPLIASARGLGIGKRLLREVVSQARAMGAREISGIVVALDLEPRPYLLAWYAREGFEILEPEPSDRAEIKSRIAMKLQR